jgi:demethylmenaquinone methyltransferase / 2-methoxy-6-polyprenyl-1,4-benzoquinol methylase
VTAPQGALIAQPLDIHSARTERGRGRNRYDGFYEGWRRALQPRLMHTHTMRAAPTMVAIGAKPTGTADEASAAQAVRRMFDLIAPRYDLLNHVLSLNVDRLWWRCAAQRFRSILAQPDAAILDVCCGTGDMTMALVRHRPSDGRPILAADFARGMLARGARKFAGRAVTVLEADALHLPLRDASLDLIVTAFGFRNLANYRAGLREFQRVLKPGGQLGILEFSEPGGLLGKAYQVYFRRVLPAIGRVICGKDGPYNYLPASVGSFPAPAEMLDLLRAAGYAQCAWQPYTFGIAGLYTAARPQVS